MKGKNETIDKEKKLYKLLILYNVIMLLKYDLSILDLNKSGDQKYEYKNLGSSNIDSNFTNNEPRHTT